MQKISPFLWFDSNAKEAMEFYVSVFKNSKVVHAQTLGEEGDILLGKFEIEGQEFMVLNGGPHHAGFTPAISFFVNCVDQEEVDYLWDRLVEGGEPMMCGWLTDKFGIAWQIIPAALGELMSDPDPEKSGRVMQAMMQMVKIDVPTLERAHAGE